MRPETIQANTIERCPFCNLAYPEHDPDCELKPLPTDTPPTPDNFLRLQRRVAKEMGRLRALLTPQREDDIVLELEPDYGGLERQVALKHGQPRTPPKPVDVLSGGEGSASRTITSGNAEPVLIAGTMDTRRSLVIANYGAPVLGTTDAIAAAAAFIGFDPGMQRSGSFYLPANQELRLRTTAAVFALDDGTNRTALSVIETRIV